MKTIYIYRIVKKKKSNTKDQKKWSSRRHVLIINCLSMEWKCRFNHLPLYFSLIKHDANIKHIWNQIDFWRRFATLFCSSLTNVGLRWINNLIHPTEINWDIKYYNIINNFNWINQYTYFDINKFNKMNEDDQPQK